MISNDVQLGEEVTSIGSGVVIFCGITVGARSMVGAGAVVTRDAPADSVVAIT